MINFNQVTDPIAFYNEMQGVKETLLGREIPEIYPADISAFPSANSIRLSCFVDRFEFIGISSFALVSKSWLRPLAKSINEHKCLEIMAGRGVLSKGLSELGVDITAVDDFSFQWKDGFYTTPDDLWFDVIDMDCISAIEKYGESLDYIICSWPDYNKEIMYKSLIKIREVNPSSKIIYIGEGHGGCTADDNYFEAINYLQGDDDFDHAAANFQQWWGIHDKLELHN